MVPRIKQASLLIRESNVTYDVLLSLCPTETFLGVSACRLLPELHFKITPKLWIWAFAQPVVYTTESFNDWRGRGCHKFAPVLGGDGTKIASPGDIFDQPPGEMS